VYVWARKYTFISGVAGYDRIVRGRLWIVVCTGVDDGNDNSSVTIGVGISGSELQLLSITKHCTFNVYRSMSFLSVPA